MNPPDFLFRQLQALGSPGVALVCDRFSSAPLRHAIVHQFVECHIVLPWNSGSIIPGPAKVPTERLEHPTMFNRQSADGPVLEGAEAPGRSGPYFVPERITLPRLESAFFGVELNLCVRLVGRRQLSQTKTIGLCIWWPMIWKGRPRVARGRLRNNRQGDRHTGPSHRSIPPSDPRRRFQHRRTLV
jgi:hypothetical protein